jgi:hypothetical protein
LFIEFAFGSHPNASPKGDGRIQLRAFVGDITNKQIQTNTPFLGLIKLKIPNPIPLGRISIITFFVLIQRK